MPTEITLHEGDNRDSLRRLVAEGVRVHAVVSDPPYGLVSVVQRFGKDGAAAAKFGSDGAFARASGGFMGSSWDATGIERDPEFWRLVWDILLPGGYVVAFSSPRTGHWQACAMELAGFVMHPFLGWIYGQGFPKDHDAAKAIDAMLLSGRTRTEDMRRLAMGDQYTPSGRGREKYDNGGGSKMNGATGPYEPRTEEALRWNGWSYGAQALKPALEPIYVGQKPFSEKNGALNLLKHGVGAVNLDECRVGDSPQGRHPANLLHDGSAEVVALFPVAPGQLAPSSTGGGSKTHRVNGAMWRQGTSAQPRQDTGSAARFFNAFPITEAEHDDLRAAGLVVDLDADVIRYQRKATKEDRADSKHPTVKPVALMQWLCRLVTPPGGTVLDPFAGSGTTAEAARRENFDCMLMEADPNYAAEIRRRFALPANDPFAELLGEDPFTALLG